VPGPVREGLERRGRVAVGEPGHGGQRGRDAALPLGQRHEDALPPDVQAQREGALGHEVPAGDGGRPGRGRREREVDLLPLVELLEAEAVVVGGCRHVGRRGRDGGHVRGEGHRDEPWQDCCCTCDTLRRPLIWD